MSVSAVEEIPDDESSKTHDQDDAQQDRLCAIHDDTVGHTVVAAVN
jgi:hypothetical protein